MNLSPAYEAPILAALDAVVETAQAAREASDLDAIKAKLNAAWFAVNAAYSLAREAETETRREALAKLEQAA